VAAYLRGDAEAKPGADKILERLTLPQAAPTPSTATPVVQETVKQEKLDALTRATEAAPKETAPAVEEKKAADLEKANEKLSSLLGKPK
jgi:hypothetical protein